jgi:hypothetical protein
MTSIEPTKSTSILEWPLTPQEWSDNYEIYHKEYRKELTNKYGSAYSDTKKSAFNFRKNNIILNNALLNAKTKPNTKKRKRLEIRINEIEKKISDKQEEIDNEQDTEKKKELEYEKELIISPELLEAAKLYISEHNLAFAKTHMDQSLDRKPEKLSQLAPDISEMIRKNLTGKGKKRRKNTRQKSRKKKGGKKSKKKKNKKGKSKSKRS